MYKIRLLWGLTYGESMRISNVETQTKDETMKRINPSVYLYKGHTVDGQDAASGIDWRISKGEDWIISLPTKRDCKQWIDDWGD